MTGSTLLAGKLSIVGTPIGNLSDASPRVKETLAAADVILCEDTRVTSKLLSAFDIHVPLQRCDQNIIESQIEPTLERLRAGQRVAFVSDAGMPGISDPGQHLVDAALSEGLATEVIPGPSAVTCALVASGLASDHFFFEGFLPRKHGQIVQRLQ
ncbi:MAG: rRNA small subunit methyltransferase 1, partial [Lancefieldella parvula]|nr:rRNA small subunit methyltransferase 1 [Lancefieldella parvula]